MRKTIAAAALLCGLLTGCSGAADVPGPSEPATLTVPPTVAPATPPPASDTTPPADSDPPGSTPPPITNRDMTKMALSLAWAAESEAEKDVACTGLRDNGTAWTARQLRAGGGDSDMDWDYAATLLQTWCGQRG